MATETKATDAKAESVSKSQPNIKPAIDPERLEKLRVIQVLLAEKFLYIQSSFDVDPKTGKLIRKSQFTIRNQSTRDNPQKELPAMYCPITGLRLDDIDMSTLDTAL